MKINHDNLPEWAQPLGTGTINDIRFSPNGDRIVVTRTSSILIYDAQTGLEIALITADMAPITAMVFSADGDTIISGSEDGVICFSKTSNGRQLRTVHDYEGDFIAFSPDGNSFAARVWGMSDWDVEKIHLFNTATCTLEQTFIANDNGGFLGVVFSPDAKMLAISECEKNVLDGPCPISLWDITTGACLKTLAVVNGGAFCTVFSPDGRTLASGGGLSDHSIDLWDVATGEQRQVFTRQEKDAYARALAFSTDGCILASGHEDCVILLWDVDTGKQLKTLTEHTAQVNNLCFSPDSYTLVSGCGDGKVLLWE
jgi:WD40 repeat protein